MASYHCEIKRISRGEGRSATAAAAYRAGERITCEREGRTHDYRARSGVEDSFIHAPANAPDWVQDRATLWNKAEEAEKRKNSLVSREWELALPSELTADQRRELASDYARALVDRYGAAVDVVIHAPSKHGDVRNHHAHLMVTTRKIGPEGFGAKTRVLDDHVTGPKEIVATRAMWADFQNRDLERYGHDARVDHRSLEAQRADAKARGDEVAAAKLDRPAEKHMGPEVSAIERRAQRQAERDGREYQPVTERGREVAEAREYRSLFDRVIELRTNYGQAREEGQSRLAALRSSLAKIGRKENPLTEYRYDRTPDMPRDMRANDAKKQNDALDRQMDEKNQKLREATRSEGNRRANEQQNDVKQRVEAGDRAAAKAEQDKAKGRNNAVKERHGAQDQALAKKNANRSSSDAMQRMRESRQNGPRPMKDKDRDR